MNISRILLISITLVFCLTLPALAETNVDELNKRLFHAVIFGTAEDMEKLLSMGADMRAKGEHGDTLFRKVMSYGDARKIDVLFKRGAVLEDFRAKGGGILDNAISFGDKHPDLVKYLIAKGADVNERTFMKTPPLIKAIHGGQFETAKILAASGADLHSTDELGRTPLIAACVFDEYGSIRLEEKYGLGLDEKGKERVRQLNREIDEVSAELMTLKREYSPDDKTKARLEELDKRREEKRREILELSMGAMKGLSIHEDGPASITRNKETLKRYMADRKAAVEKETEKNIEMIKLLLGRGVDVNEKNKRGETALMIAARHGYFNITKYLLEHGADPNAKDRDGETALQKALRSDGSAAAFTGSGGNEELVNLLTKAGAKREIKGAQGGKNLYNAIEGGNMAQAMELIAGGADVNFSDDYGHTPLISASMYGMTGVIAQLISKGAEVNANDRNGVTPLMAACMSGQAAAAQILLANGADATAKDIHGTSVLHYAFYSKSQETVKVIIKKGVRLEAAGKEGDVNLCAAAWGGLPDVVKTLIANGANVNAEVIMGSSERTPIGSAVEGGNLEVARMLIKAGANVNVPKGKKRSPLISASGEGNYDMVKLLLDSGADPTVVDGLGMTALSSARLVGRKNENLIKLLEQAEAAWKEKR